MMFNHTQLTVNLGYITCQNYVRQGQNVCLQYMLIVVYFSFIILKCLSGDIMLEYVL